MKNQKGNVAVIILIVVVLLGLWWLIKSGYSLPQAPKQTAMQSIDNSRDLDTASKSLDGTNLNDVDTGLSGLNSDTSGF
ncbi:MAG TPA: hypothetical protein VKC53_03775 [Patescibacteria group bacterium]|nr:hypothetical protein [Patescibacteria group bacterium]